MEWMIFAVLCGYFIKGMCGFANTLIIGSILSFVKNNVDISPVELLLGYPANSFLAWKFRRKIDWKVTLPLSVMVVLGAVPGALILKNADTQVIKIVFGLVVMFLALEMLLRFYRQGEPKATHPAVLVIFALLSGVMSGMFGIGALLAAYISRTVKGSGSFKGTLGFVFFVDNTFRIILYSVTGVLQLETLTTVAVLLPFMLMSFALGMLAAKKVNEKNIKKLVTVLLMVSGLSLILSNIGSLFS